MWFIFSVLIPLRLLDLYLQLCCVRFAHLTVVISGGSRISQRWGRQPQGGGANLLFCQSFPENCMKMKDFGHRWGGASLAPPLRSANGN